MAYTLIKYIHVLSAAVLLGTGAGIAFFMLKAHLTKDPQFIAGVTRIVIVADFLFTATAVVLQPITGSMLAMSAGFPFSRGWVLYSIVLYLITGAFWLPVVWMQIRLHHLAADAAKRQEALPKSYHTLFRVWFAFGFPAFGAVLAIFWLMIDKPGH
jgi:uncharacterized membrane protein